MKPGTDCTLTDADFARVTAEDRQRWETFAGYICAAYLAVTLGVSLATAEKKVKAHAASGRPLADSWIYLAKAIAHGQAAPAD